MAARQNKNSSGGGQRKKASGKPSEGRGRAAGRIRGVKKAGGRSQQSGRKSSQSNRRTSSGRQAEGRSSSGYRSVRRRSFRSENDVIESEMRLQKFLAAAGVDSRRNCEEYIRTGRVTVDSRIVTDPALKIRPEEQDIRVDGERLRPPRHRYFLLNKPKGVLCTNRDPMGRPRAVDLIPVTAQRLFTVGRLDENTSGLLLITNDGELAEHLAHPRYQVIRRYRVQVAGVPKRETIEQLKEGMYFSDGFFRFRGIVVLKRMGKSTLLELELREGKNREIRRLLAKVGHKVMSLQRVQFGPLRLGFLKPAQYRELRPAETKELLEFARSGDLGTDEKDRPPRRKGGKPKKERANAESPHDSRIASPTAVDGTAKTPPAEVEITESTGEPFRFSEDGEWGGGVHPAMASAPGNKPRRASSESSDDAASTDRRPRGNHRPGSKQRKQAAGSKRNSGSSKKKAVRKSAGKGPWKKGASGDGARKKRPSKKGARRGKRSD